MQGRRQGINLLIMNTLLLDRSIHVLLISNFPDDGETIQTLLNSFPYPYPIVLHNQGTFASGVNLLDVYDIDILLLATNLTDKDPKEALMALAQSHKEIPVVMLSSASLLDMGFFYFLGAQQTLSRSGLTAPHLAQTLAWTLEKKELTQQLSELQEKQGTYFWELDIENNTWKNNEALERFVGEPIVSLNQFLHKVPSENQEEVARAFMGGIRGQEAFEIEHSFQGVDEVFSIRLSGTPQVSKEGQVIGIKGQFHVLGKTEKIKKPVAEQLNAPETPSPASVQPPTPTPSTPKIEVAEQKPTSDSPAEVPSLSNNGKNGTHAPTQKYTNINYLKQVSGGDTGIMRKAISKFLETTPDMIHQLDTQLKTQDFDQLAKTAHKLKSSVGLMGMDELQQTMQNIEFVAKSKERLDVLPVLVNRTRKMLIHSLTELEHEMETL